jgi:hypothetical protein
MNTRIFIALCLYTLAVGALAWARPAFLVGPDGEWKRATFDTSAQTSVFGPAVVFPVLAVLCFYIAALIMLVLQKTAPKGV